MNKSKNQTLDIQPLSKVPSDTFRPKIFRLKLKNVSITSAIIYEHTTKVGKSVIDLKSSKNCYF